jgi:hypothetical protein
MDDSDTVVAQKAVTDLVRGDPGRPDVDHDEEATLRRQRAHVWNPVKGLEHTGSTRSVLTTHLLDRVLWSSQGYRCGVLDEGGRAPARLLQDEEHRRDE